MATLLDLDYQPACSSAHICSKTFLTSSPSSSSIASRLLASSTMRLSFPVTFLSSYSVSNSVIQLFLRIVFVWSTNLCSDTQNIPFCSHKLSIRFLYPLILDSLNKWHSITILFFQLVHFLLLLMTEYARWRPMFPCQEHLSDEGPCSSSRNPSKSLVCISLLDIIHS